MGDFALLVFMECGLLHFVGSFLFEETVVVAGPAVELTLAELKHARADGVEEGAVVRNYNDPAGVVL